MEILLFGTIIIFISLITCSWIFRSFYLNSSANAIALAKFGLIEPLMLKLTTPRRRARCARRSRRRARRLRLQVSRADAQDEPLTRQHVARSARPWR